MRLPRGVFWGEKRERWECQNLALTLSVYGPARELPWHCHANPGFFLVLRGQHRDRARRGDYDQPELSLVFHPTTEAHAGFIGPKGTVGLNIEYDHVWLERHGLREQDLGGLRPLASVQNRLQVLQFLGTVFQDGNSARAECEIQAFELLEPLVQLASRAEREPKPSWFRRAEEFILEFLRDK
jgi:hypothetical protein